MILPLFSWNKVLTKKNGTRSVLSLCHFCHHRLVISSKNTIWVFKVEIFSHKCATYLRVKYAMKWTVIPDYNIFSEKKKMKICNMISWGTFMFWTEKSIFLWKIHSKQLINLFMMIIFWTLFSYYWLWNSSTYTTYYYL